MNTSLIVKVERELRLASWLFGAVGVVLVVIVFGEWWLKSLWDHRTGLAAAVALMAMSICYLQAAASSRARQATESSGS